MADTDYHEAFAAYVDGNIDAQMHYGFSIYGVFNSDGDLGVSRAYGFVNAVGKSDLTYTVAGFGKINVASADNGNPLHGGSRVFNLKGSKIKAGNRLTYVNFEPFLEVTYKKWHHSKDQTTMMMIRRTVLSILMAGFLHE